MGALFWVGYEGCTSIDVRDIYRLEFEIFKSWGWVMFYLSAVAIFCTHMCLGWQKVVPAPSLDIPKRYHSRAIHVGYVVTAFIALIYLSFPLYGYLQTPAGMDVSNFCNSKVAFSNSATP